MIFGKPAEYKTKEYSSVSRSLNILERKELAKRAQMQLRWRLKTKQEIDSEVVDSNEYIKKKEGIGA